MKLCQTTADLQEEVALARAAGKSHRSDTDYGGSA